MYPAVPRRATSLVALCLGVVAAVPQVVRAQDGTSPLPPGQSIVHDVRGPTDRIEITVNQSRILTLDQKIPKAQVNNPAVLELTPLSENQISVHALTPGVTSVHIWGEDGSIHAIDFIVYGDVSELRMVLEANFPRASVEVRALSNSVLLSGFVDQAEHVARIQEIAQDYYPQVINLISVGGVQQVLLHVKVMEVSRTGLRRLSTDYNLSATTGFVTGSVAGLINAAAGVGSAAGGGQGASAFLADARLKDQTIQFGVLGNDASFFGLIDALRKRDLVKVLAEPTLVTVSGRPAFFQEGGEFPILVPQSLGTVSIQYRRFGTQVDFVPLVLGNGMIRLEVRPRVSELDLSRAVQINNTLVPALRVREADTGVEMRAGQTLAMAGLIQTKTEAQNAGLPYIADLPYIGLPFRRVQENVEEVELLILVTPELVEAMDPDEVPPCGPGFESTSPNNCELYFRGHLEVPICNDGGMGASGVPTEAHGGSLYEQLPAGAQVIDLDHDSMRTDPDAETPRFVPQATPNGASAAVEQEARRRSQAAAMAQQIRNNSPYPQQAARPAGRNAAQPGPGLIGPVGYDLED